MEELKTETLRDYQNRLRTAEEDEARDILTLLLKLPITFEQLQDTKIGKTVKRVGKKYTALSFKTKEIITAWRKVVESRKKVLPAYSMPEESKVKAVSLLGEVLDNEEIALAIEEALHVKYPKKDDYVRRVRSLKFNLTKNEELRRKVVSREITPEDLVTMKPGEMATAEKQKQMEQASQHALDSRRSDWNLVHNKPKVGMYRCGKCNSNETTYYQQQTRSADEPMTT